ncbi:hypothetical protein SDC9_201082 [bioreactor metagenome]|uniref:Uncharacterized protein n=1 Tax=bioreactor metagenome TaxID=1076179 RepID=A0A645IPY7_9ZZZZ
MHRRDVDACRHHARHGMQAAAAGSQGVLQRQLDARLEFGLAPRQRGQAAFALRPVSGRQIEKRQRQVVPPQPANDFGDLELVREQELDRPETVVGRRSETIEELVFRVHQAEVGGKTRHGGRRKKAAPTA